MVPRSVNSNVQKLTWVTNFTNINVNTRNNFEYWTVFHWNQIVNSPDYIPSLQKYTTFRPLCMVVRYNPPTAFGGGGMIQLQPGAATAIAFSVNRFYNFSKYDQLTTPYTNILEAQQYNDFKFGDCKFKLSKKHKPRSQQMLNPRITYAFTPGDPPVVTPPFNNENLSAAGEQVWAGYGQFMTTSAAAIQADFVLPQLGYFEILFYVSDLDRR